MLAYPADTGNNMKVALRPGAVELVFEPQAHLQKAADKYASAILLSGQGNSGENAVVQPCQVETVLAFPLLFVRPIHLQAPCSRSSLFSSLRSFGRPSLAAAASG